MEKKVCRTCFRPAIPQECFSLTQKSIVPNYKAVQDMLQTIIPELNLSVVEDAVVCTACCSVLESSCRFRNVCLGNEKKLKQLLLCWKVNSVRLNFANQQIDRTIENKMQEGNDYLASKCNEKIVELSRSMNGAPANTVKDQLCFDVAKTLKVEPALLEVIEINSDREMSDISETVDYMRCWVPGCEDVTFPTFGFPEDPKQIQLWLKFTGLELSPKSINKSVRICSRHFEDKNKLGDELKNSALPTLDVPGPLHNYVNHTADENEIPYRKPEPKKSENKAVNSWRCYVPGCEDVVLPTHRFPKNPVRRKLWLEFTGVELAPELLNENIRICSRHFEDKYKYLFGNSLRACAIPTLDVPGPLNSHIKDSVEEIVIYEPKPELVKGITDCDELKHKHTMNKKIKRNVITCSRCRTMYDDLEEAALHAKQKHNRDHLIYCKMCKKVFYYVRTYRKHIRSHGIKLKNADKKVERNCKECRITFAQTRHYYHHLIQIHNRNLPHCETCNRHFPTKFLYDLHVSQHLSGEADGWLCDKCGRHFRDRNLFLRHRKMRHKMLQNKTVHRGERSVFMCERCGAQFKHESTLKMHEMRHVGIQVEKVKYRCTVCSKGFDNFSCLKKHSLIHTDNRLHTCNVCNRGFIQKAHLKRHMIVHTGEKPFACDTCGARFKTKNVLKHHLNVAAFRKVHETNPKDDEQWECKLCGKNCFFKVSFTKHMRTHDPGWKGPNVCDICGKTFSSVANRKRHMAIHMDVKVHSCAICDEVFRTKPELVIHIKRHTGDKQYKCAMCDLRFVERNEKNRHQKIHLKNINKSCTIVTNTCS